MALGLVAPCRLERRFKLQPGLPRQSMPTAVRPMLWSLVPPDRISPCAVKCGSSAMRRKRSSMHSMRFRHRCTYERGAPAHDVHPQGRILNKVSRGAWLPINVIVMAQAKRAAEDMPEQMRRAQLNDAGASPSHGENRGSSPLGSAQ